MPLILFNHLMVLASSLKTMVNRSVDIGYHIFPNLSAFSSLCPRILEKELCKDRFLNQIWLYSVAVIINSLPKFGFITINFLPSDLNHNHTSILWQPEYRPLCVWNYLLSASYVLPGPPLEILTLFSSQVLILLPLKCRMMF